ncbi:MAG: carbohydrate ABC transporter permease, partial [Thermomicrobiales bacterium]
GHGVVTLGFLLPALVLIAVFSVYPALYAVYLSLTNMSLIRTDFEFVGLENFSELVTNQAYLAVIRRTFVYVGAAIAGKLLLGFGLALALNAVRRGRGVYGALLFLPWVFSEVVAVSSWRWILNDSFGLLNYYLGVLGLGRPHWLADPDLAMVSVVLLTVWKGYPFSMVLLLAGLQTISNDLREAARVDGANALQVLRDIVLPTMKFVVAAVIMLITIYTFNVFSLVFAMTGGGPVNATEILGISMYRAAFQTGRLGFGSAVAVLMFLINLAITLIYLRTIARREPQTA